MSATFRRYLSFLLAAFLVSLGSLVLSLVAVVLAHHRLGWPVERANGVANTIGEIAFVVGWVVAFSVRR